MGTKADVKRVLSDLQEGREDAAARMLELVYEELRRIAGRRLDRERADHTLQPTALVHEAWMRLFAETPARFTSRVEFVKAASSAMRRVLIDHARRRQALKRPPKGARVSVDVDAFALDSDDDLIEIDHALERLAGEAPRKALVLEMLYFGGATIDEIAEAVGVSARMVKKDAAFGRAWLQRELKRGGD